LKMTHSYERELRVAIDSVRQAAILCQAVQIEITADVLAKKDRSPVTVADFGSQALVCRALHEAFPSDPIVAEEDSSELKAAENAAILGQVLRYVRTSQAGADGPTICDWIDRGHTRQFSQRFWTLDPIDGTKGFLRGEQYAVSLALIIDGHIEVGLLGCPSLPFDSPVTSAGAVRPEGRTGEGGSVFYAVRGHGAWMEPLHATSAASRIRVSSQADAAHARFCESVESGHSSHGDAAAIANRLGITQSPIRMDSQAKYAVVARGEAEVYLRLPTRPDYHEKIWDHAGGVMIVTEAGGVVTDIAGNPLDFRQGAELLANRGVIVTNGMLHNTVLSAVRQQFT
jgi:3'(2'), 5'-bisphosphate nucleotidase